MAFSIYSNSGKTAYGVKEFMLDSESDLLTLPTDCTPGSVAYVINSSLVYTLNNQKQWKQVTFSVNGSTGAGGSSSGSGDNIYDGGNEGGTGGTGTGGNDNVYDGGIEV